MITRIGNRRFGDSTYIMGILNVTPDSFSDGGRYTELDSALYRVEKMLADGADIIDVGGESTRPGSEPVSAEEEALRVVPVVSAIASRFDVPVSVDTFKAETARAALGAGAVMVNDINGFCGDNGEMAAVTAEFDAACCLMYNNLLYESESDDFIEKIREALCRSIAVAKRFNVRKDGIVLDGGIGFGTSVGQCTEMLANYDRLGIDDFPMLLGASRKSFLGSLLGQPVDMRLSGTLATTAWAAMHGCRFVRVHDIAENRDVIRTISEINRHKK